MCIRDRPQGSQNPQRPQQQSAQPAAKQPQPERKRERRVIDTSAVTVNADRYDDRVDSLVSDRVQNYSSGKQKIGSKNKKQQQAKRFGTKSRSEEQEKMRRLQLEIAKKAQLVVKIPDEITVGELASRMKKTATEVIKTLLKNGVMATINQTIDFDTAEFVATEMGCKVEREVVARSDGGYELDGDMTISDFLELLGWNEDALDDADSATVGGWTLERFGTFPKPGDSFRYENLTVTVLAMDGRRVERVLVQPDPASDKDE